MEDMNDSFKKKVPVVHYNPELDKYSHVVLFPEKVAKAREAYERLGIPDMNKINQKKKEEV